MRTPTAARTVGLGSNKAGSRRCSALCAFCVICVRLLYAEMPVLSGQQRKRPTDTHDRCVRRSMDFPSASPREQIAVKPLARKCKLTVRCLLGPLPTLCQLSFASQPPELELLE